MKNKVLIVDDQMVIRAVIVQILKKLNVPSIFEATDGSEALALIKKEQPEFVICDVNMRPVNGFDLTRAVRSMDDASLAGTPIFLMSSTDTESIRENATTCGANGVIEKPMTIDKVKKIIQYGDDSS